MFMSLIEHSQTESFNEDSTRKLKRKNQLDELIVSLGSVDVLEEIGLRRLTNALSAIYLI